MTFIFMLFFEYKYQNADYGHILICIGQMGWMLKSVIKNIESLSFIRSDKRGSNYAVLVLNKN